MTELPGGGSPVDAITPGTRLREWEVVRFRARGSYGVVFEARRSSWLDEPARALKVFDPIVSRAARHALLSEFSTLTAVRHRHLLAGIDAFDIDAPPFAGCVVFVLELAEEDLSHRVAHAGGLAGLPSPQVAAIGAEVATGMAALHAMARIHGDVKPENILLVRDGPPNDVGAARSGRWVLGDFGVTAVLEGSYAFTPGTTIDYRPPEMASASHGTRLHRSSDVWALGVSLYVAATGRHPFPGPDPMMRYAAVVRGERPAVPPDVDPALWSLIETGCLDPDPRRRLDAATLAARLHEVAAGSPPPPPASPSPGAPWSPSPTAAGPVPPAYSAPSPPGAPVAGSGAVPGGGYGASGALPGTAPGMATSPAVTPWVVGSAVVALVVAQLVAVVVGALDGPIGVRRGTYVTVSLVLLAMAGVVAQARWRPTPRQLAWAAVAGVGTWAVVTVQLLVGVVGAMGVVGVTGAAGLPG